MQFATVPLSSLLPPKDNPRRTLDKSLITGLAQSIKTDGVLQNLLVHPEGEGAYRVIFGKRRFLALQLLKKNGDIDGTYPVPVDVKEELDDNDAARLAMVENVQREQLHPMDEAEAFARQLQSGGTVEAITEKSGLSAQTVKRRLALATLCSEAKKAFRAGTITRSVAEALTLGSKMQQRAILEAIEPDYPPDADEIRETLLGRKPSLAMGIFPREQYKGGLITDLFADDETTYFDDVDQFLSLQHEAVEALAEGRRQSGSWVEVLHLYTPPWWQYREAGEGEPAGTVINVHPSGAVEVRDGLVKHEVEARVVEATRQTPLAPRPAPKRPVFSAELLRYIACQRSAAVQATLLTSPRRAKEVAVLIMLLGFRTCIGARFNLHPCHATSAVERDQRSYRMINDIVVELSEKLGLRSEDDTRDDIASLTGSLGALPLYEALGRLTDGELDRLQVLLPILCFGEENLASLDSSESLFNRIAADVGAQMRTWWVPDAPFLSSLLREQIVAVVGDCGAASALTGFNGWTKRRLVDELARYFAERANPETLQSPEDQAALNWTPGMLRFPAVGTVTMDQTPP
ncbi:MAG TPA: ParB/RepB/Spo0J family partition protein [Xanthobacteraceae bacterium]|nr:ParB/RepB/Spo0J family partition protein [Xanthobacteraceae bacterium]